MARIEAPFTKEQVEALNRWQKGPGVHPFTCGADRPRSEHKDGEGVLVATEAGWVCPDDDYTQNWAHDFMAMLCTSTFKDTDGDELRCDVPGVYEVHGATNLGTGERVEWDPFGKEIRRWSV